MLKKESVKDLRMYGPILDVLREVGGEARGKEVMRIVADRVLGGTQERYEELKSGGNKAENEVAWARNDLRELGLIDGSIPGIWLLTTEGWSTHVADIPGAKQLREKVRNIRKKKAAEQKSDEPVPDIEHSEIVASEEEIFDRLPTLIDTIRALPPKGFERLCQRILRESGFAEVSVTGKSGDGGIDGNGVLQINELEIGRAHV